MTGRNGRQYLRRITQHLTGVWEKSIQRRVDIQGREEGALNALLTRTPVLLLGDPGSGKTTLLQSVAYFAAQEKGEQGLIPFLITASSGFSSSTSTELGHWLSETASFDPPPSLSREVVDSQRGIILIDGLDEISPDCRDRASHRLQKWLEQHPSNRWVFSSRAIGGRILPTSVLNAKLLDLSPDEISSATRVLLGDLQNAAEFRQALATHRKLSSLSTNPLLLGILAQIYREQSMLPVALADLYGSWTDIALRQWDKMRGVGRREDFLNPDITREALSRLALQLLKAHRVSFELPDWLEAVRGLSEVNDTARQSAELTFRENVLGSGIVRSIRPTEFAFSHLTIQEYFASQALLRENPDEAQRLLGQITFENVASFYAESAPDPLQTVRLLTSAGRLDEAKRLFAALPNIPHTAREEVLRIVARQFGVDNLLLRETARTTTESQPTDSKAQLRDLWRECHTAETPNERGLAFEEFAKAIFSRVFEVVDVRRLTTFGEIDIICEVKATSFWIRWPGDCFIECKNLKDATPVAVANEFIGKCSTVRVRLAFLVCAWVLTQPARERVARTWSQTECPDTAWIDGEDIENWLGEPTDAETFLKRVVRRGSYGIK